MANDLVIRALKTNPKSLKLTSRNINRLPKTFARLTQVLRLHLNNNRLTNLPAELQSMRHLTELNLGNNAFEEMPPVLKHLQSLERLYLYGNHISRLDPEVFEGLPQLTVLNLNRNKIKVIPPAIKFLLNLERFSVAENDLDEIPPELGLLSKLTDLNLARNRLNEIPHQLYKLTQLRKLCLARNDLTDLPEGILGWENLKSLDVAGNRLRMFPLDFQYLALEELFFEENSLIQLELFASNQEVEVLSLKEQAARFIIKERSNSLSVLSQTLALDPDLQLMLSHFRRCALCFQPFLTTWLECVQFINLQKDMGIKASQVIPVRVLLCSYSCFSKSGHSYCAVTKV